MQKDSESNSTQQQQGGGSSSGASAGGASVATRDSTTGGTGSGSAAGGGQQKRGQEQVYKDGQNSPLFVDITKDATRASGKEVHLMLDDGKVYAHITGGEVYLGGKKGEGTFAKVSTVSGPSMNVYARIS